MAKTYSITLEIGHEAKIRTKRTPEGFTHEWEVFVRGVNGADIQYFIDEVIFNLHQTFPKPKRIVKKPPYSVRESGYAGFTLPIEIILSNGEEPKKIQFQYDLHLQQSGPAICKVQQESFCFNNPNEEFRHKLLKGGAVLVNNSNSNMDSIQDSAHQIKEKSQLINKRKPSFEVNIIKKPKVKVPNSFQGLFGPPITASSNLTLEIKPQSKEAQKSCENESENIKNSLQSTEESPQATNKSEVRTFEDIYDICENPTIKDLLIVLKGMHGAITVLSTQLNDAIGQNRKTEELQSKIDQLEKENMHLKEELKSLNH